MSNQFPAFLSIEYREDGNGFPAFERAADRAYANVEDRQRRFEAAVASGQKALAGALSRPLNGLGALDLNVKGLLDSARNSEQAARAARELANATQLAATAAGDSSQAARLEVAAMQAVAIEHEQAARKARSHAEAMAQVQAQLDKTAAAATKLTITGRGMSVAMQSGTVSAGQLRMASIGVGQQMQDIAVSLVGGQRATTVFAQQIPQLAYALSGLEGAANKTLSRIGSFATFLSGPWGAAMGIGALALGALASGMGEVDEASKAAQKATDDFKEGLLDVGKFADTTTGHMLKLADATVRAALAMNQLKQNETGNQLLDYQQKGLSAALDYARSKGNQWHGVLAPTSDTDIGAALRKSGFRSGLGGYQGNLFTLEAELQKAAKTRPELRGLADEVSVLAAQSVEAAKGMKSLRENAEFLTGKREIVPGFKAPKTPKSSRSSTGRSGTQSEADLAVARAAMLVDADRAISEGIAKSMDAQAEKLGRIGSIADQIAEERARQREIEQSDAERLLATYQEMLGLVTNMGGATGKVASLLNGLITGNFQGLGRFGNALNLTSAMLGKDGWREVTAKLDTIFGGAGKSGSFTKELASAIPVISQYIAATSLGTELASTLGFKTSKTGGLIGGFAGAVTGGLLKKHKIGYATIGGTANGLGVVTTGGNSGSRIKSGSTSANAVISSIEDIALQLGASVDASKGRVSIGISGDSYHVDPTGQGRLKKSQGGLDFNQDAQAAVEYAMLDLIKDGVLVGLKNGTKTLLQNADALQDGLAKALKFEGVFRDLKKIKDPVGAAIDDLNREYQSLIKIFKEAGATTAETAQLEELYNIKRKAAVEDAMKSLTGSLQDLYKNLTIGDSGYSLRTRITNAKADYNPLAARVAAGDTTAYDDFANAAQTLIDLQREYSGSAPEYFALLDQVTQLTKGELDRQQAQFSSSSGAASPFDTTPIVDATTQGSANVVNALAAVNDNMLRQTAVIQQLLTAAQANGSRIPYIGRGNF